MRLGVFQSACGGLTQSERVARLASHLETHSVDLVVCPELFMSGYNVGDDLITRSEPAGGTHLEAISDLAIRTRTAIQYGYPEKDAGRVFNSAAVVTPDGQLLANHRKRFNSPNSFEERYFQTGDQPTLFGFGGIRFAILICFEVELTELAREVALLGAEVILVSTALVDRWRSVAEQLVPTRAFENGVWLAYANHAGSENGFDYLGGSRIVAPDGTEMAVAGHDEELITADLDMSRLTAARDRLPYLEKVRALRAETDHGDEENHAQQSLQ